MKHHGGLTQVELAGATGLSPASVSNIVKELVAAGVLATSTTTRSGRRAQYVTLARTVGLVAGVHFGTRHLHVAVADATGLVLADQRMPLAADHRADAGLDRLALLLADMVDSLDASLEELLAVGLGIPAPFDSETGQVTSPGMLRGWGGVDVAQVMSRRIATPVFVDNDANLGALSECYWGAGVGGEDLTYIKLATGIGSGHIIHGDVYRGAGGTAGEIGHIAVDSAGPPCLCGLRGCLVTLIGSGALVERARELMGTKGRKAPTIKEIVEGARAGDPAARTVIDGLGQYLGIAVAGLLNLLNPAIVVLGGEISSVGDLLLDPLRASVRKRALSTSMAETRIVTSALGDKAIAVGAATLVLQAALRNRVLFPPQHVGRTPA